jgi:hypothetical protein
MRQDKLAILLVALALTLLVVWLPVASRTIPVAHASSVIAGYAYSQNLTVTNPATTTVGGSVVAGTVPATSTDYVVQLHLTSAEAASVYANAQDKAKFTDVTVWWWNSSSYVQLDVDYDPYTNGSWSANNVTLWFKLQAPIAGSGTDPNYVLAWDKASPVTKRDWTHIYPFSDDFNSSAGQGTDGSGRTGWNSANWSALPSSAAVGGGTLSITSSAGSGSIGVDTWGYGNFGHGYALATRTILPVLPMLDDEIQLEWWAMDGSGERSYADDNGWSSGKWVSTVYAAGSYTSHSMGSEDSGFDVYSNGLAMDGTSYAWRNDDVPFHNTAVLTPTVVCISLETYNPTASTFSAVFDYIKVRPFQPAEPTVAVVGSPLTGLPASANPFSLAVNGAALSIASPSSSLNANPIILNGSSQSVTSTLPLTVTDARGTGAGWTLSIDAADPKTSGGKTIPFSGMTFGPQYPGIADSSGTSPLNLATSPPGNLYGPDSSPGTTTSSPNTLLTAPALQGMGMYTQNEGITLTVPATASTGTYTTTLVLIVQ